MGLITLNNDFQKLRSSGAAEIRTKINALHSDITFLSGIIREVNVPEDAMNCSDCLSNIHKKICDAIHLIQYYNIIISSASRTCSSGIPSFNIGPLEVTLPSCRESKTRRIINSALEDLNQIVGRCNSLLGILLTLSSFNSSNLFMENGVNDNDSGNRTNQSEKELNIELLEQALAKIAEVSEDNQDSILILRNVIEWDFEKTEGSRIRFLWINSRRAGEEDCNENVESIDFDRSQMSSKKSSSFSRRHLVKLKHPIILGFLLSLAVLALFFKYV